MKLHFEVFKKPVDGFQVAPLSRKIITECSYLLRKLFGYENIPKFPIKYIDRFIVEHLDPLFYLAAESKQEMGDNEGLAVPKDHIIYLREDVYEKLEDDDDDSLNKRAAFTLAHEIGHYFLHANQSCDKKMREGMPSYYNSEWQANAFAADFLIPPWLLKDDMSIQDISDLFGVSSEAARYQHNKFCV